MKIQVEELIGSLKCDDTSEIGLNYVDEKNDNIDFCFLVKVTEENITVRYYDGQEYTYKNSDINWVYV